LKIVNAGGGKRTAARSPLAERTGGGVGDATATCGCAGVPAEGRVPVVTGVSGEVGAGSAGADSPLDGPAIPMRVGWTTGTSSAARSSDGATIVVNTPSVERASS
jgi:hypothetical protein